MFSQARETSGHLAPETALFFSLISHPIMTQEKKECELVWRDINLTIKDADGNTRRLLSNVSGRVEPSTIAGLMGTSGAGKTTLMNALAARLPLEFSLKGEIYLNSHVRSKKTWSSLLGYVEHTFNAYEFQTVHETLVFASRVKMGGNMSGAEISKRIDEVIATLGLGKVRNTYIKRLSSGERKRVSIGVELLGNPPILFCDEPTSGLDSFNALNILKLLKELSNRGKTVLVTIHQPSFEMLAIFDKMILMSAGCVAYDGDVDGCIKFFEECGFKLPSYTNPADFFLNTISLDTRTPDDEERSRKTINHVNGRWRDRKLYYSPKLGNEIVPDVVHKRISFSFGLLLVRNIKNYYRNFAFVKTRVFQKVVFFLFFGLTYLRIDYSEESILTRVGALVFLIINSLFGVAAPIYNTFPAERDVITRERRSAMYSGPMAYASKFISEVVFTLSSEIIFLCAIYWVIGLNSNAGLFFIWLIIMGSLVLFSLAFSLTISTLSPSQNVAQVLGTVGSIIFIIYSGAFNNPNTIPSWLRWLIWVSPAYYAVVAVTNNQLRGATFYGNGSTTTGEEEIASRGLNSIGVWPCIFLLWGITLAWGVAGALALQYATRSNIKLESNTEDV
jgi:ATP-binding cassette, subfamily G (WHITE), eye pigment precursor transporter